MVRSTGRQSTVTPASLAAFAARSMAKSEMSTATASERTHSHTD